MGFISYKIIALESDEFEESPDLQMSDFVPFEAFARFREQLVSEAIRVNYYGKGYSEEEFTRGAAATKEIIYDEMTRYRFMMPYEFSSLMKVLPQRVVHGNLSYGQPTINVLRPRADERLNYFKLCLPGEEMQYQSRNRCGNVLLTQ